VLVLVVVVVVVVVIVVVVVMVAVVVSIICPTRLAHNLGVHHNKTKGTQDYNKVGNNFVP
jgi:hypothetical protein